MGTIKVLIVDDSAFMRKVISDFINSDPRLEVAGTARNGDEAIKKVSALKPDVVTLDVEMPVMDGITALKIIMSNTPVPVVMLSSTTEEGAKNTVSAMQYGAIDFITKPSGSISLDLYKVKEDIINRVILASKANIKVLKQDELKIQNELNIEKQKIHNKLSKPTTNMLKNTNIRKIVCIGTSTGGPRALQQVLTKIPKTIKAPILIVQHMPSGFTKSLATRLDTLCQIKVKEAEDGDRIEIGTAYIAPGGFHMKVKMNANDLMIQLDRSEQRNGHRPSVDVMFESISEECQNFSKIAVIMTGMGSDGTVGLKKLKSSGNTKAIAESEESSIVFGMPKTAIATNLVDEVVHLDKIALSILKFLD